MSGNLQRTNLRRFQIGVALITALLSAALASTAAVEMVARQQIDIRRTENLLNRDQAYGYLLGAESWAIGLLVKDLSENTTENTLDASGDIWATELPPIAVEGGTVSGKIEDMQGLFNLNNLVDAKEGSEDLRRFQRLLEDVLGLDPSLAYAVVDWLDENIEPDFSDGAEDDVYQNADPPYRTANRLMVSVSELRLVQGFTEEVYERLQPFVTALPERTRINVNTAPPEVLRTLADDFTQAGAEALVNDRGDKGFKDEQAFLSHPVLDDLDKPPDEGGLAVESRYFLLRSEARIGRGLARLNSVLRRSQEGVHVVIRSQGAL